jgi:hypothetical protein
MNDEYEKENDPIISMLREIEPIEYQYSTLGKVMNGYFKTRSIDHLQKNVNKKMHIHEFYDLPKKDNQKKISNYFDIDFKKIDSYLNEYSIVNSIPNVSKLQKNNIIIDNQNRIKLKKIFQNNNNKRIDFNEFHNSITADPGRYYPNYNSIYKNSYHAFFGGANKLNNQSNIINEKSNIQKSQKMCKSKSTDTLLLTEKDNLIEEISKITNNKEILDQNSKKDNEVNNKNMEKNQNSYSESIKSDNLYLPNIQKSKSSRNKNKIRLIKNNSTKNIKRKDASSLDFSKMTGRKDYFLLNYGASYRPNYNYNLPHISTIRMPKETSFRDLKKFLINKFIRNYKLNSDNYMIMEINKKYNAHN